MTPPRFGVGLTGGAPVGAALSTYLVGRACHEDGRWSSTYLGALAGTAVGLPLVLLGSAAEENLMLVALLTPAIGAPIGCNLSRTYGSCGERLLPGSVALSCATGPDGAVHPSLDLRMVNIRFWPVGESRRQSANPVRPSVTLLVQTDGCPA